MTTLGPIVLVHGYWHGSWCWTAVTEELAARGLASVAVDLAGHGLDARSPAARWSRPFDAAAGVLVNREGEDVGGTMDSHEFDVEVAHAGVVHQGEGHFAKGQAATAARATARAAVKF